MSTKTAGRIPVRELAYMAISISFVDFSIVWYCACEAISLYSSRGSILVEDVLRVFRYRLNVEKHNTSTAVGLERFVEYFEKKYQ